MLSVPEFGWVYFSIDNLKFHISNVITDLPYGWLEKTISGLKNNNAFVVQGWCEPENIYCTVTKDFCYIVCSSKDDCIGNFYFVQIGMKDFAQMLHSDISKNIDAWVDWENNSDSDEEKLKIKNEIQNLLEQLKLLL